VKILRSGGGGVVSKTTLKLWCLWTKMNPSIIVANLTKRLYDNRVGRSS
jgi:hypothetical protein